MTNIRNTRVSDDVSDAQDHAKYIQVIDDGSGLNNNYTIIACVLCCVETIHNANLNN